MTENEKLLNLVIQHRAALEGYSNGVLRRMNKIVRAASDDVEATILSRFGNGEINERDWAGARLLRLRRDLTAIMRATTTIVKGRLGEDLGYLAKYEAQWLASATKGVRASAKIDMLSAARLEAIVTSKPFSGFVLREHVEKWGKASADRLMKALQIGLIEGDDVAGILNRLTGYAPKTRAPDAVFYKNSAMPVSQRTLNMVTRTAITHVNAATHQAMIDRNPDLYDGVLWVSVLDDRTSVVCRGLDGQVFPVDDGPRPPAHPNCRSTILPLMRGIRPPKIKTYEEWLREQDADVQRKILGPTRWALWSTGRYRLKDFIVGLEAMTIDELRARDREAFSAAGLEPDF